MWVRVLFSHRVRPLFISVVSWCLPTAPHFLMKSKVLIACESCELSPSAPVPVPTILYSTFPLQPHGRCSPLSLHRGSLPHFFQLFPNCCGSSVASAGPSSAQPSSCSTCIFDMVRKLPTTMLTPEGRELVCFVQLTACST